MMDQLFTAWMPYLRTPVPAELTAPVQVASFELKQGMKRPVELIVV